MKFQHLIACMNEHDFDVIWRSHIKSNALIINQCSDYPQIDTVSIDGFTVKKISTNDRGLSKSRNLALKNAEGEICLICDDDEIFIENYEDIILSSFEQNPKADIIAFALDYPRKKFSSKPGWRSYLGAMKISSVQIAFRRKKIIESGVTFDELMGAGTGHGCGEEIKFLFDCLKKGLKLYYCPEIIAKVNTDSSTWFNGYSKSYFYYRGWSNKKILGIFFGLLYSLEYSIAKHKLYKNDISFWNSIYFQCLGLISDKENPKGL